jgi:hypothetical protein
MVNSVRTRLTLWYIGVLAIVLVAFSTGVYSLIERDTNRRVDTGAADHGRNSRTARFRDDGKRE